MELSFFKFTMHDIETYSFSTQLRAELLRWGTSPLPIPKARVTWFPVSTWICMPRGLVPTTPGFRGATEHGME